MNTAITVGTIIYACKTGFKNHPEVVTTVVEKATAKIVKVESKQASEWRTNIAYREIGLPGESHLGVTRILFLSPEDAIHAYLVNTLDKMQVMAREIANMERLTQEAQEMVLRPRDFDVPTTGTAQG